MTRFLLLLAAGGLAGCGPSTNSPSPPSSASAAASAPVVVTVASPKMGLVTEWDAFSGRLEAKESVEIRARVSGYLDKIHFQEGKEVAEGDLLFTIDKRPAQADFNKAQADVERAESSAKFADAESARSAELLAKRAVSQQDFDSKVAAQSEARAAVRSAVAAAEIARLTLDFCEVRSPIAGRIGRVLVTRGNLVSGGANVSNSTVLASVVSIDPIYCSIDVDERAILRYRKLHLDGLRADGAIPCEMGLTDEVGWPHQGVLDFVDNRLDANTGTIRCRAVFKNKERPLSPGLFARVRIPGATPYQAVLIPDQAIGTDLTQKFVYVVKPDGAWSMRPVVLGSLSDGLRIVKEGLKIDEKIIVNGQARVRPGVKLSVQEEAR